VPKPIGCLLTTTAASLSTPGSHDVLRYFIPGDVEINMTKLRIVNDAFKYGGLLFNRTNDSTYTDMRPDKGGFRMS
jgi:hypothetical protein